MHLSSQEHERRHEENILQATALGISL